MIASVIQQYKYSAGEQAETDAFRGIRSTDLWRGCQSMPVWWTAKSSGGRLDDSGIAMLSL
jgi:hypothetical protein